MRIIALIAAYNERRFISSCLEHLHKQGVETFVIDNESTDDTVAQVERFKGRGLVGIETFPRLGRYRWMEMLRRKEQLAQDIDADWFIHLDPDEVRLPPAWATTLAEALAEVDQRGFNAVNFMEYVFLPTRESTDHDHPRFQETMRWYYPFEPRPRFRLTAWRKQAARVDLATSGGHSVDFPGLRPFPESFPMRHYLFLSRDHAVEKYGRIAYDAREISRGWHGWRVFTAGGEFDLPPRRELRESHTDAPLDASAPRTAHFLDSLATNHVMPVRGPEWTIDEIRHESRGSSSRIEISVAGEPLWFESDDAQLDPNAEAFASLLLLPALECGASIRVVPPVDARWLGGLERIINVFCEWWHYPNRNPVLPENPGGHSQQAAETAACFTCGVDSFYTLLRSSQPDMLVFVRGFDMPLDDHHRFAAVRKSLDTIAAATGKKIVVVSTNLRTHPVTGAVAWPRQHGAALAAVGHVLRRRLREFIIPSSDTSDPHEPWGSHWRVDEHFSSASLKITHDAPHVWRYQKVAAIAGEPLVHRHLRVCWENRAPAGNCSSCEKCVRTMLDLCAAGTLPSVQTFDHSIPLAARLDALPSVPRHLLSLWNNSLTQPLPDDVRAAAQRLLARSTADQIRPPAPATSNDWKPAPPLFPTIGKDLTAR